MSFSLPNLIPRVKAQRHRWKNEFDRCVRWRWTARVRSNFPFECGKGGIADLAAFPVGAGAGSACGSQRPCRGEGSYPGRGSAESAT